jgi:hypothetical protein
MSRLVPIGHAELDRNLSGGVHRLAERTESSISAAKRSQRRFIDL